MRDDLASIPGPVQANYRSYLARQHAAHLRQKTHAFRAISVAAQAMLAQTALQAAEAQAAVRIQAGSQLRPLPQATETSMALLAGPGDGNRPCLRAGGSSRAAGTARGGSPA